ncbi:conserved hypothetical protein, partial [Ricinus communis]
ESRAAPPRQGHRPVAARRRAGRCRRLCADPPRHGTRAGIHAGAGGRGTRPRAVGARHRPHRRASAGRHPARHGLAHAPVAGDRQVEGIGHRAVDGRAGRHGRQGRPGDRATRSRRGARPRRAAAGHAGRRAGAPGDGEEKPEQQCVTPQAEFHRAERVRHVGERRRPGTGRRRLRARPAGPRAHRAGRYDDPRAAVRRGEQAPRAGGRKAVAGQPRVLDRRPEAPDARCPGAGIRHPPHPGRPGRAVQGRRLRRPQLHGQGRAHQPGHRDGLARHDRVRGRGEPGRRAAGRHVRQGHHRHREVGHAPAAAARRRPQGQRPRRRLPHRRRQGRRAAREAGPAQPGRGRRRSAGG